MKKTIIKIFDNKCLICGISNEEVPLQMAHLKAISRGGKMIIPLCPNCHNRFDRGLLSSAELKKIGLTERQYKLFQPKKGKSSKANEKYDYFWGDSKKRYRSEATLPKSACRPGKHNWITTFVFGVWRCTKCKAKRTRRSGV